ncbi:subtilase cytotoxin subunit B [Salmonella enterica]|nr:subtilase cytotoxin subunit B [Salmonella enterica]ECI8012655.1 subtilase cytotoxin subunit B [Salmonella enterica subsp. enterica]HEC8153450.1 subtilase cytotoxin subunit B [Salmonella enterica subsp. enterica serovar Mississippi]EBM7134775.1 subtilase cytotoxin subunit B [Salmonella enterica]EJU7422173.1 subtilase cytotoxin subunit B [Salmonella enterica]
MQKIISVCALLILICSFNASAQWTGDNRIGYYKFRVITELHVGQVDNGNYFCIKLVNVNGSGTPVTMCSVSNQSIWSPSFEVLKEQARYFYATGQSIMAYFDVNAWKYKPFVDTFSNKVLTGFSTCSATECFGPTPK